MKYAPIFLALSTCTALLADTNCYEPTPREEICCECYTPAFDEMECDWNLFFDAEFLYWYASESNLVYAIKEQEIERVPGVNTGSIPFVLVPKSYKNLGTTWDPGVRAGLGVKIRDGWDVSTYWTYFNSEKKASTSVPSFSTVAPSDGNFGLLNPWTSPAELVASGDGISPIFDRISAKWNLTLNQIDLQIGRKFWLSQYFLMRPYMGMRGAWANTGFRTKSSRTIFSIPPVAMPIPTVDITYHNHNWGVGLLGGIQPSWYFAERFSLFGDLGVALLWGNNRLKERDHYQSIIVSAIGATLPGNDFATTSKENFFRMQTLLDLALGLRFETNWCQNRYAFALDAGWEHHIWFNYNKRNKRFDAINTSITSSSILLTSFDFGQTSVISDLMFGGFVLKARFDF